MKALAYILVAALLVGSVVALTDYRTESYKKNQYYGFGSLQQLDKYCPEIEVHHGYFVKQIMVRTSKELMCQFPSSNGVSVAPAVAKPICMVETCELVKDECLKWNAKHTVCKKWSYVEECTSKRCVEID